MQRISKAESSAKRWSAELDKQLCELAGTMGTAEIAKQMGRTSRGIEKRAGRLRISLAFHGDHHPQWTAQEDEQLKQLAGTMPITKLAETLKRSTYAVVDRGVLLGVPVGYQRTPPSRQRRDEITALVSEGLSAPQIARRMGLSIHCIRQRLSSMGLKPLTDGRGCPADRTSTSKPGRPKKAPVPRITTTVSRLAKCDGCGLWVINTYEGWAAHRARLHSQERAA